jgi:hypothetical protein
MPPTSQIVKNLAEEIRGKEVGKNWVAILKSAYLRNIANPQVCTELIDKFEHFFKLVKCDIPIILIKFKANTELVGRKD